jgi:hypothetical protein
VLKNNRPNDRRVRGFSMSKAMERSEMAINKEMNGCSTEKKINGFIERPLRPRRQTAWPPLKKVLNGTC